MTKRRRTLFAGCISIAGGCIAWSGLVDLAERTNIKHGAFEVVLGFALISIFNGYRFWRNETDNK